MPPTLTAKIDEKMMHSLHVYVIYFKKYSSNMGKQTKGMYN